MYVNTTAKLSTQIFVSSQVLMDVNATAKLLHKLVCVLRMSKGYIDNIDEPIQEQMQLFANSKLVIAPHGAGLSNIIVMQKE